MCYNLLLCNLENLDVENKYKKHVFNYQKDKVKPRPRIYIKNYRKKSIKLSRYWYGLNI